MTSSNWIQIASIVMFLGVGLGAFGAHALKDRLTEYYLDVYKTGVLYHFIHGLALFVVAWLTQNQNSSASIAGYCFLAGIVIFSGSLYILSITGIKWLGAVTPIGGILFIIGWGLLYLKH